MKKFLLFVGVLLSSVNLLHAQTILKGVIVDNVSNEPVIGANVIIKGITTEGTISDFNGAFSFSATGSGAKILTISFIGYENFQKEVTLSGATIDLGTLSLSESSISLSAIEVIADVAIDRKTPVAVSTIKPAQLEEKLGAQEFPEVLKSTPGVYATKKGGGYGDSRINLRGFDSDNIGVLINGVPVNDMETGRVYWSNWAGLSDVTSSMQVQRGLGASKLAIPSAGGTINILTKGTDVKKGGSIGAWIGNDGYSKQALTLSTGLMDNGWAVTFSGSKTEGDGYINGTSFKGYSYFLSIGKKINDRHDLVFTAFGAPQTHDQRSNSQSLNTFDKFGKKYNADYGYRNGEYLSSKVNTYHKPQMSLNHYWTISDKTELSTSAYLSIASGGGRGFLGNSSKYPERAYSEGASYRTEEGLIDFDQIVEENIANGDKGSSAVLAKVNNNHLWTGVLSSINHEINNELTFSGGIDLRYYKGKHYQTIENLLGGNHYVEKQDANHPNRIARRGDNVNYNNDGVVLWEGIFGQLEYSKNDLSVFVSGAFNNTSYKRIENLKELKGNEETSFQNFLGYSIKGGANYNLTETQNVFFNAGYFTRAPRFGNVFLNYSNKINKKVENEKILSAELGYGVRSDKFSANINLYNTYWLDKYLRASADVKIPDPETGKDVTVRVFGNVNGVDALHQGLELDFLYQPVPNLDIRGMASIGFWEWQSDVEDVPLFDENQQERANADIYLDGVKVSDAAQTTFSLSADYKVFKGLKLGADFNYYDDLYAYASVTQDNAKGQNSWQLPAYSTLDANVKYSFKMGGFDATLYGKVNNLLDTEYISDARNGASNDAYSAQVFYGFGRTWSMGLKLKF